MTADELIAKAVEMADARLKRGEEIHATCYVHLKREGEEQILGLDYNAAPFSTERTAKQAIIIMTIRAVRGAGYFDGAILVSEAWMKRMRGKEAQEHIKKHGLTYDKPIAEEPDRVDTLFTFAYGHDGSRRFQGWALKPTTTKGQRYRALKPVVDTTDLMAEGWFDRAFHDDHKGEA
jgi:hypothetical protein